MSDERTSEPVGESEGRSPSGKGERTSAASEPGERSGVGVPASEPVGESEGRSPSGKIERRVLILWFALAFVVWNGVYDMRMHDTVRGYLVETTRAQAG